MPATLLFISSRSAEAPVPKKAKCGGGGPECEGCLNAEFDPERCEDCVDGSNYESDDDYDRTDDMTVDDFRDILERMKA